MTVKAASECQYYIETTRDGRFIGRCREWPKVRTRPLDSRIEASGQIVSLVAEHLRYVNESIGNARAAKGTPR